jgi:hypothetical protein
MNKNRLLTFAPDLRKTPPRRPRETLGGFVIAARMLDKARADLLGINGNTIFTMWARCLLLEVHGTRRHELQRVRRLGRKRRRG